MTTFSVYGAFAILRDEVFPSSQTLKEFVVIPPWPWWLWVIFVLIVIIGCAYEGTYRRHASLQIERDQLQHKLDDLTTPKLFWEWRPDDTRFFITDGGRSISLISLINRSAAHVEKIEAFCYGATPVQHGEFVLHLNINLEMPRRRLSRDEHVPIRVVAFTPPTREFNCLVPYRSAQDERLQGRQFLMKLMIVGTTPTGVAIPCLRILARFGIDHDNQCFVSYENL